MNQESRIRFVIQNYSIRYMSRYKIKKGKEEMASKRRPSSI